MATNKKKTLSRIASKAAKTLSDKNASKTAKSFAASTLAQSGSNKQTGSSMEDLATVLDSSKYNANTTVLASSVLSQSNKKR